LKGGSEDDTKLVKKLRAPYERWLHWSLAHPKLVVKRSFIALGISLLGFVLLGKAFIPVMQEGSITPVIVRAPNISLDESIKLEFEAIKRIMTIPGVEMAVSRLGKGESPADPGQPNESDPIVTLKPLGDRDLSQEEIAQQIREKLKTLPGIELAISQPIAARVDEMVSGVRSQVAVKIFGEDLATLQKLGSQIGQILTKMKGSNDLRIEQASGQNYLNIKIDRDAIARYGINVSDVNEVIETAIGGKQASTVYEGERRFPLVLRYPASYRNKIDAIENIVLSSPNGAQVLMRDLAEISLVEGPAQISRESGKRRLVVGVNVEGRDLGGFVEEAQKLIAKNVELPQGYTLQWGGQFENMQRAMARLMIIIPLTILAIFFLLFMLFKSIRLAGLIILVLPFASIGGVFGLFLTGEYLSVPAAVGFINLWGIAVLNGVVLISFIKQLREDGYSMEDALLHGCGHRFRPVMMTASVAMLALVPMLFSGGPGSEVTRPLAAVVIAGLVTSTALTLLVLPVLYRWFEEKEVEA
jgi:cobalt-zinc-cadmium resistance protein CzcA